MSLTSEQQQFLQTAAAQAVTAERDTGCPAEISVGQAVLESGWGAVTSGANNFFGIKAYPGCPGVAMVSTTEWFTEAQQTAFLALGGGRTAVLAEPVQTQGNRNKYNCQDLFAAYPNMAGCFEFHGQLLQRGPYLPAWQQFQKDGDLDAYVRGIAVHYATDPAYATKVLTLVHDARVTAAIAAARA
jgi:flagellum-specific peptidoglycan hydrolase FlgJ